MRNSDNKEVRKKRTGWKRGLRVLVWLASNLIFLLLLLILFIRSPWGQDIVVGKVTEYVSKKTDTQFSIKKLFITFSGDIYLEGLYLEDQEKDTLLYSESLQAGIPIWPIITGNPISIDGLEWNGVRANVVRKDSINGFNYQFLIDAFTSESTTLETESESKKDSIDSKPPKIAIGSIGFSDFKVNYNDAVTGMNAKLNLGNFHFEGDNFDLEKMKFEVAELYIENTQVIYEQTKPFAPSADTTDTKLPFLSLGNLKLKNVYAHYKSIPDGIDAEIDLSELNLQVPKADLASQDIEVGELMLKNSSINVKMDARKESDSLQIEEPLREEKQEDFTWPAWNLQVESIALQNNNLKYLVGEKPKDLKMFNQDYINLTDFNFIASDIELSKVQSAQFKLKDLSFKEESGLILKQLALNAELNPTSFSIEDLIVKTLNSSIDADLATKFTSLQDFIDNFEKAELKLDLNEFSIDLNDLFVFNPELKENEYLNKLSSYKFTGQIHADGQLTKMNLSRFLMNWGQTTSIQTNGQFLNLTDPENFYADIKNLTFKSNQRDIKSIISEEDIGITIPLFVNLQTQAQGSLDDLKAQLQLNIPEGKINLEGKFKNKQEIAFNANIDVIDLNLGDILNNPSIGVIAFKINASGKGNSLNEMNAKLASQFSKLEFNEYDFSALELDGKLNNGIGDISMCYKDNNLDLNINSKIELDSVSPKVELDFKLEGADLMALGLTQKNIKAKLKIQANFKGNAEKFEFDSNFSEGVAVYDKNNFYLGPLSISAGVTKDSTSLDISSEFLNGKLRSNADPDRIAEAIQFQLKNYFLDTIRDLDTIKNPVDLQFNLKLSETKLLSKLLVPEIKAMDTLDLSINFNQKEQILKTSLSLPYLNYADNTIDSLKFILNSTADEAMFKFGFSKVDAGPIVMNRTYFDGDLKNGLLNLHLHAFDGNKEIYVVRTEISGKASDLKIHINPEKLIFQAEEWSIPEDNLLNIKKENIIAENIVFSRNNERIEIANNLIETSKNNIGIGFTNFKLANLLALFNKDDLLASGDLQGNIVAIDPFNNFVLNADFNIDDLTVLQAPLGKLLLKTNSENGDNYNLDLSIKGEDIDLVAKGDYSLLTPNSALDFELDLNKLGIETIAIISGETLDDASGNISGEVKLSGSTSSPDYKGFIKFNDAQFNVTSLNSKFRLANDKINIDNSDITLNQFSIEDEKKNTFTLDGSISTKSFSDPDFDLNIKAKNFQALNSTKEDNEIFYGDVNFDMDGSIKGKLSAPKLNMDISINENTKFTYAIQNSQAKIEKRDGIVEFVNKENPDDIITRTDDSTNIAVFGEIELHTKIHIDKGAEFNVIVDPKTGDDLNISGEGDLIFDIEENGRTTLSGRYTIAKGHYNLSLYNLVKREFELEPGSYISWRGGDPLDADLNVTAKYSLETSASALMASQTAGASQEVKNKYQQRLPFLVYLNVKGELNQPELNFNLGMPEDAQGAIDGTVYGRIKQLNTEEDDLNKQVFSLLVLKKFYPNAGSDGSGGGTASMVRKNINEAISDQLNSFSDKLMGNSGVELNFGLNSYTDYQGETAEQRTDLNVSAQKKLLDDRLIVQVGSTVNVEGDTNPGEENSVVGNASIQYLLTEDGRWRIKGFRDSQYENVIDGQVYVNGIALIFQRQFNQFNELFGNKPIKGESTEDIEEKKDTNLNTEKNSKTDKKANN